MSSRRARTQPLPFSTGAIFSRGKREHMPWPMAEAIVSMMGRPAWPTMAAKPDPPLNGVISSSRTPSHSLR